MIELHSRRTQTPSDSTQLYTYSVPNKLHEVQLTSFADLAPPSGIAKTYQKPIGRGVYPIYHPYVYITMLPTTAIITRHYVRKSVPCIHDCNFNNKSTISTL